MVEDKVNTTFGISLPDCFELPSKQDKLPIEDSVSNEKKVEITNETDSHAQKEDNIKPIDIQVSVEPNKSQLEKGPAILHNVMLELEGMLSEPKVHLSSKPLEEAKEPFIADPKPDEKQFTIERVVSGTNQVKASDEHTIHGPHKLSSKPVDLIEEEKGVIS